MTEVDRVAPEKRKRRIDFDVLPLAHVRAHVGSDGMVPIAECLACGHVKKLAVWKPRPLSEVDQGLCGPCRDAAAPLRGPCGDDCYCEPNP